MAKAYLLRKGFQEEFDRINLYARELGFALDTSRLLVGDGEKNIHIPSEPFVSSMIKMGVAGYSPTKGKTVALNANHAEGTFAYDIEKKRVLYKDDAGLISSFVRTTEVPSGDATTIKVAAANIDAADLNKVTLSDFRKPYRMIYLNGKLCTNHVDDPHQYEYDVANFLVTIKECVDGDIISYF